MFGFACFWCVSFVVLCVLVVRVLCCVFFFVLGVTCCVCFVFCMCWCAWIRVTVLLFLFCVSFVFGVVVVLSCIDASFCSLSFLCFVLCGWFCLSSLCLCVVCFVFVLCVFVLLCVLCVVRFSYLFSFV